MEIIPFPLQGDLEHPLTAWATLTVIKQMMYRSCSAGTGTPHSESQEQRQESKIFYRSGSSGSETTSNRTLTAHHKKFDLKIGRIKLQLIVVSGKKAKEFGSTRDAKILFRQSEERIQSDYSVQPKGEMGYAFVVKVM